MARTKNELRFWEYASFPTVGDKFIVYVATDTNTTYLWNGSIYVAIWDWGWWATWPTGYTWPLWPTWFTGYTWPWNFTGYTWPIWYTWPVWPIWATWFTGYTWPLWPTWATWFTGYTW